MPPEPPTSKFTVNLDLDTDGRFERLTHDVGQAVGRLPSHRGLRYPSRADVLRALLLVAEQDARVRHAVQAEVRAEGVRRNPFDELTAIAGVLYPIAPTMDGPEAQESLSDQAADIEYVAGSMYDDRAAASERLEQIALNIERLAARYGGYDGLRPLLDLAHRLQVVRDALEPAAMRAECPRCRQPIRVAVGPDGLEQHNDQAGVRCAPA